MADPGPPFPPRPSGPPSPPYPPGPGQAPVAPYAAEVLYAPGVPPAAQGLSPAARARISEARAGETWTSGLSVDELAAIRSVGFEPVGQVMGSIVHRLTWQARGSGLGWQSSCGYSPGILPRGVARPLTSGSAGTYAWVGELTRVLYEARRTAMARMAAECAALGGDGVVGVRLVVGPFPAAGSTLEFQAFGTAVRAQGPVRPPRVFLSHLSGQDFAKLLMAGWVPVDMALGVSLGVCHDVMRARGLLAQGAAYNYEVPGWSELVGLTRYEARQYFLADVARAGADGAVVSDVGLRIFEQACSNGNHQHDHVAEAVVLGTAVAAFRPSAPAPTRTLTVMSLNARGRARGADLMSGY